MSVLKYFKNTLRSPPHRATGPKCNFFSLNLQRGPWKKNGACRPWGACRPSLGRPLGPAHGRGRGSCRPPRRPPPPPRATGVCPPYISSNPPLPSSFEPENSTKNPEKKRSEEKESVEALPDSVLVICRLVHLVYIFFHLSTTHLSRSNLSRGE